MLGTFVEVTMQDPRPEEILHALAEAAFQELSKVQSLMSFHEPASELSRLNESAHLRALQVHPWTREVIAEAIRLGEASGGIFDIAVAPHLMKWGLLPNSFPSRTTAPGSYRDIEIHSDGTVSFRRPLILDLGGIAKGFAVDKAAEMLTRDGVHQAVVNAGGDLRFIGAPPATLLVRNPRSPHDSFIPMYVQGAAAATSAPYFTTRRRFFRKINHFVHPKSRRAGSQDVSVTVFSHSCIHADALTKIVLLAPTPVWQNVLFYENARCTVLTRDGTKIRFPEVETLSQTCVI